MEELSEGEYIGHDILYIYIYKLQINLIIIGGYDIGGTFSVKIYTEYLKILKNIYRSAVTFNTKDYSFIFIIGLILVNDLQPPHPDTALPPLKVGHVEIKDAQCDKTQEKTIFRFLIFKIWSILYPKFLEN